MRGHSLYVTKLEILFFFGYKKRSFRRYEKLRNEKCCSDQVVLLQNFAETFQIN